MPGHINKAAAAGVGQAELEQRIASIREKFAEKHRRHEVWRSRISCWPKTGRARQDGRSEPRLYKEWDKLNDMFKRGKLDVEGLTKAQAELLKKQPVTAAETRHKPTRKIRSMRPSTLTAAQLQADSKGRSRAGGWHRNEQCRPARTDRNHGPDRPADSPAHHPD